METTVKDIMRKRFVSLKKTDPLSKALAIVVSEPDMAFPVMDSDGKIIGEIRQHELLKLAVPGRYVGEEHILGPGGIRDVVGRSGKSVGDVMKTHEMKIKASVSVTDAAKMMLETDIKTLEVVDNNGKPVGFVSELDVLKYLRKKLEKEK